MVRKLTYPLCRARAARYQPGFVSTQGEPDPKYAVGEGRRWLRALRRCP
jgi:hypothetical protein